ncbi:hypothetical protein BJV74DRAFT_794601 [Russula compacta]|nr:hypothetical protein BJV74DRAFT_794601 [Russula compacta]
MSPRVGWRVTRCFEVVSCRDWDPLGAVIQKDERLMIRGVHGVERGTGARAGQTKESDDELELGWVIRSHRQSMGGHWKRMSSGLATGGQTVGMAIDAGRGFWAAGSLLPVHAWATMLWEREAAWMMELVEDWGRALNWLTQFNWSTETDPYPYLTMDDRSLGSATVLSQAISRAALGFTRACLAGIIDPTSSSTKQIVKPLASLQGQDTEGPGGSKKCRSKDTTV